MFFIILLLLKSHPGSFISPSRYALHSPLLFSFDRKLPREYDERTQDKKKWWAVREYQQSTAMERNESNFPKYFLNCSNCPQVMFYG